MSRADASSGRDAVEVIVPAEPPRIEGASAGALLRILLAAAADSGDESSPNGCERKPRGAKARHSTSA